MTTLQFRLNDRRYYDGKTLQTRVDIDRTTVLDLKHKVFQADLDEGKVVRLLFMGKMMQDHEILNQYKLKEMSFLHCMISNQLVRPEGAQPADGQIQTTDDKIGFDRFLRMRNKQYTDLQIHQARLALHSILMRSGVEKTDETADGLLTNEEKWLKKELPNDDSLHNLLDRKTVLS